MPEHATPEQVSNHHPEATKPIGEIILGKIDPRALTYEQFLQAPDILYHGSVQPLRVDTSFDYDDYTDTHESAGETLGRGLYTTDNPSAAYGYGRLRNRENNGEDSQDVPVVTPVLPFEARMFDFREKTGEKNFSWVPQEILALFTHKFAEHAKQWIQSHPDAPQWQLRKVLSKASVLKQWADAQEPVTLFEMIAANPTKSVGLGGWFPEALHETFADLGYDGIIHPDGGQHGAEDSHGAVSYVFYNLDKVGSYQDWQKRKNES